MTKTTQRALSLSFLSFAILAALSVVLAGCPDEKKGPVPSASAATSGSAAASAAPAGSGW